MILVSIMDMSHDLCMAEIREFMRQKLMPVVAECCGVMTSMTMRRQPWDECTSSLELLYVYKSLYQLLVSRCNILGTLVMRTEVVFQSPTTIPSPSPCPPCLAVAPIATSGKGHWEHSLVYRLTENETRSFGPWKQVLHGMTNRAGRSSHVLPPFEPSTSPPQQSHTRMHQKI